MLVLFDNGTPRTLARYLIDRHAVTEACARGWQELENGALLNEAEFAGFEVLVTTDKNLNYQQNLSRRKIAVVVLGQGRWTLVRPYMAQVVAAVNAATPGSFVEVKYHTTKADSPLPPEVRASVRRKHPPSGLVRETVIGKRLVEQQSIDTGLSYLI